MGPSCWESYFRQRVMKRMRDGVGGFEWPCSLQASYSLECEDMRKAQRSASGTSAVISFAPTVFVGICRILQ